MMLQKEKRGTTEKRVSRKTINCDESREKHQEKEKLKIEKAGMVRDRWDWKIPDSGGKI